MFGFSLRWKIKAQFFVGSQFWYVISRLKKHEFSFNIYLVNNYQLSLSKSFWCNLTTNGRSLCLSVLQLSWQSFTRSTSHLAGALLRTQGGAVLSVKLFGRAVFEKAASSNTEGQAIGPFRTDMFWMGTALVRNNEWNGSLKYWTIFIFWVSNAFSATLNQGPTASKGA